VASITKRGDTWQVKWRDPDGAQRGRKCPTRKAAKELKADVEESVGRGLRWVPPDETPIPRLGALIERYAGERKLATRPKTMAKMGVILTQFLAYAATKARNPGADVLTKALLVEWHNHLTTRAREVLITDEGERDRARTLRPLTESSAANYVRTVEQFWRWAQDDDEADNVPRARRLDLIREERTEDVVAPTWAQMDACVSACRDWHRRLAIVLRFTGLRVTQAMHLLWSDIDLDATTLRVRPNLPGSKTAQERKGRRVPISEHLAAELAGWGLREGWLIDAPTRSNRVDGMARTMARAWVRAGVPREVWAPPHLHTSHPHHAFRAGFQSELRRSGADAFAIERLVGHTLGGQRDSYTDPTALPLRAAVGMIPVLEAGVPSVFPIREQRDSRPASNARK
jgi:integrase